MKTLTFAQEAILNRIKEKDEANNHFQDCTNHDYDEYSENSHYDYSDYSEYHGDYCDFGN